MFKNFIKNLDSQKEDLPKVKLVIDTIIEKLQFQKQEEEYFELFSEVIDYIYDQNLDKGFVRMLLESFSKDSNTDNLILSLAKNFITTKEKAKYIVSLMKDESDPIYLIELAFDSTDNFFSITCENILYMFEKELSNSEIEYLLESLNSFEDRKDDIKVDSIRNYLKKKRSEELENYQKPYWVSLKEGENSSLLTTVSLGFSPVDEKEKYFNNILESSKNFVFTKEGKEIEFSEEIQNSLKSFLQSDVLISKEETKLDYNNPVRVWGPMNAIEDFDCSAAPEGKGPCRMLQCMCLEQEDGPEIYDSSEGLTWFKGKCEVCEKKILDISHALRQPHRNGGWKGCYCSFKCIIKEPEFDIEEEEHLVLNLTKSTLDECGIMDRSLF